MAVACPVGTEVGGAAAVASAMGLDVDPVGGIGLVELQPASRLASALALRPTNVRLEMVCVFFGASRSSLDPLALELMHPPVHRAFPGQGSTPWRASERLMKLRQVASGSQIVNRAS